MNKKYFYAAYILLALIALIGGGIGINICQEHKIQYWIAYGLLLFSFVLNIELYKKYPRTKPFWAAFKTSFWISLPIMIAVIAYFITQEPNLLSVLTSNEEGQKFTHPGFCRVFSELFLSISMLLFGNAFSISDK
ncbi:hypothetical protein [Mannheimia indoligenes]|uniref:Uncharacterized protein n=1 Tax=Mannheimia indoligenes TaxID=3103145 RepID=A0ABU7ZEI8_9PAST